MYLWKLSKEILNWLRADFDSYPHPQKYQYLIIDSLSIYSAMNVQSLTSVHNREIQNILPP